MRTTIAITSETKKEFDKLRKSQDRTVEGMMKYFIKKEKSTTSVCPTVPKDRAWLKADNTWYDVGIRYEGGKLKVYIDGALINEGVSK